MNTLPKPDHLADSLPAQLPGESLPDSVQIPVIAEQLHVDRQVIETGRVRLVKTVHQDQQTVAIPLSTEDIQLERVPIGTLVDSVPPTRREGNTTIYSVIREELVVQKRLRLVEEIRVTRTITQATEEKTVVLHREEVAIERTALDPNSERSDSPGTPAGAVDTPGMEVPGMEVPGESSL